MAPARTGASALSIEFDPVYYSTCYAGVPKQKDDRLAHYSKSGWKSGHSPNPFFSPDHYVAANRDVPKGVDPFRHFVEAAEARPYASCVFDPEFYLRSNSDVKSRTDAVGHYWSIGRKEGRSPNALFDVPYYRSQLSSLDRVPDYLEHYLAVGWKEGLSPHPLFDPDYYSGQLDKMARRIPPLAHYIEKGAKDGLSPHPLFDPGYYEQNSIVPVQGAPLIHYLMRDKWNSTPHYLFSDIFYASAVQKSVLKGTPQDYRAGPPLLHYCEIGAREGIPPHPLFDIDYYKARAERLIREEGGTAQAIAAIEQDPLRHYCTVGFDLGISATPLFDPDYYRSQLAEKPLGDPLRHYLGEGFSWASPHPAIDLDYYARNKQDFLAHEIPVILDLLMTPQEERVSPHPAFDPNFYLEKDPHLAEGGECPILHFLEHGLGDAKQPNALFTYPYGHRLSDPSSFRYWNPVDGYFRAAGNKRPRVLFLSHDASQSGAPLVLLGLLRQVSAIDDIECISVLGAGGPLVEDFVHSSLTYVASEKDLLFLEWGKHSPAFKAEMSAVARLLDDNPPDLVICNSLESRHLADFFTSYGFGPLVTLIHEVADPYNAAQLSPLFAASQLSLFVSDYQMGRMRKKTLFDEQKSAVVQFGALNQWFGSGDREVARREVLEELGLEENARIVMACGTMNFRKGIDVFSEMACNVLEGPTGEEDVHFLWVGGGETHYDSAFYWAEKLVRDRGFESRVHFTGERMQPEKYYLAADLFVLTSRADPFPCVIQEAMGCALPVIAFQGMSGAAEAIGDSGVIVPFGAATMAKAVEDLLADDSGRRALSKKARELLQTKNTPFSYASEIFEHVRGIAPGIANEVLARPRTDVGAKPKVLLAVSSWDCSEASLYIQQVARQLVSSGVDAEIVLTRGPSALNRTETNLPLPDAPFRILYPKSQSSEHVRESLIHHLHSERGPCVFVPYADDFALDVVPSLSPHVATMAIIHGDDENAHQRVYSLSRYFDHIVCTSSDVCHDLLDWNPRLKSKISVIPVTASPSAHKAPPKAGSDRTPADRIRIVCAGFGKGEISQAASCAKLAKLLREEGVDFELSVVLNPVEVPAVQAVAPDLIERGVLSLIVTPSMADIRSLMAAGDLFLYASLGGDTALLVAESMAAGCVPIMRQSKQSRTGGALKNEVNCFLVDSDDLRKVAEIIRDQQRAPKKQLKMSKAVRRVHLKMADKKLTGGQYVEACRNSTKARALRTKDTQYLHGTRTGFLRSA
jgi:glycosyltransferase involved in cell wall biosynthesis